VQIQDVTRELAESFGMDRPYGALVARVIEESPAEKAGLKIGDVIVEFDGHDIKISGELPPIVGVTEIDQKVKVKIFREGDKKTIKVVVGLLPNRGAATEKEEKKKLLNRLGLEVAELTELQRDRLEVSKFGVIVQQVKQGAAYDSGIQEGDVILRVQNTVIRGKSDFDTVIKKLPTDQSIAILIQRTGHPVFLALKIDK
jgi:serine protease Do